MLWLFRQLFGRRPPTKPAGDWRTGLTELAPGRDAPALPVVPPPPSPPPAADPLAGVTVAGLPRMRRTPYGTATHAGQITSPPPAESTDLLNPLNPLSLTSPLNPLSPLSPFHQPPPTAGLDDVFGSFVGGVSESPPSPPPPPPDYSPPPPSYDAGGSSGAGDWSGGSSSADTGGGW
jgi:hypothetical protein